MALVFVPLAIILAGVTGGFSCAHMSRTAQDDADKRLNDAVEQKVQDIKKSFMIQAAALNEAIEWKRDEPVRNAVLSRLLQQGDAEGSVRHMNDEIEGTRQLPALLRTGQHPDPTSFMNQQLPPISWIEKLIENEDLVHCVVEFAPDFHFKMSATCRNIQSKKKFAEMRSDMRSIPQLIKADVMERISQRMYELICAIILDLIDAVLPGVVASASTVIHALEVPKETFKAFETLAQSAYDMAFQDPANWRFDPDTNQRYYGGPTVQDFLIKELSKAGLLLRDVYPGDIEFLSKWVKGVVTYVKRNAVYITAIVAAIYAAIAIGRVLAQGGDISPFEVYDIIRQSVSAMMASIMPLLGVACNFLWKALDGTLFERSLAAFDKLKIVQQMVPRTATFTFQEYLWIYVANPFKILALRGWCFTTVALTFLWESLKSILQYIKDFVCELCQNIAEQTNDCVGALVTRFMRVFMRGGGRMYPMPHVHVD